MKRTLAYVFLMMCFTGSYVSAQRALQLQPAPPPQIPVQPSLAAPTALCADGQYVYRSDDPAEFCANHRGVSLLFLW